MRAGGEGRGQKKGGGKLRGRGQVKRAGASPAPTGSDRSLPGPEGLSPNSLAFQGRGGDTAVGTTRPGIIPAMHPSENRHSTTNNLTLRRAEAGDFAAVTTLLTELGRRKMRARWKLSIGGAGNLYPIGIFVRCLWRRSGLTLRPRSRFEAPPPPPSLPGRPSL